MGDLKFTPGPWQIQPIKGYSFDQIEAEGFTICDVEYHRLICDGGNYVEGPRQRAQRPNEGEGNAHLIAAAPDLYEALEAAIHMMTPGSGYTQNLEWLRAALAKARGE
jgi:hypothetical protein